jgi:hypothetical protein
MTAVRRKQLRQLGDIHGKLSNCLTAKRSIGDAGHIPKLRIKLACVKFGGMQREIHMRKITLFAAAAVLVLTGVGTWIGVGTGTPTVALAASAIDPSAMMASAKDLPTFQYVDYSLVFN